MNFDFYGVGALHFRFETIMVTTPRKQRSYTIAEKREALQLIDAVGEADALRHLGYPRRNLRDWAAKRAKIFDYRGAQTSKTLKGQEETGATVVPLPANSTAVCQPLDVGVMGPLKKSLRALWLKEQSVKRKKKQDKKEQEKKEQEKETQDKEKQDGGKEGTEELGKQKEMTAVQDDPAGECKSKKVVKKPRGKTGRKCAKGKDGKKVKQSGKGKKSKKSK
ncbi:hypothetical protein PF006_g25013 [Phytophthora fragariae]|uniref:DDE-1 domain-containing protein n=2 Tax=Phytophthora fragariae TaxID=53985 RepID=A0A6A3R7H9_9STRA|nr:hypothetical protein PF006_g25013 [Phytophthora fragariae]